MVASTPRLEVPTKAAEQFALAVNGMSSTVEVGSWPGLLPALGAVWLLGVGFSLLKLGWNATRLHARLGREPADPSLLAEVRALCESLHLEVPLVKTMSGGWAPFVTGWNEPTLAIDPFVLKKLATPERHMVLAHELTHLSRGDHRTTAWMSLLRALFLLHPSTSAADIECKADSGGSLTSRWRAAASPPTPTPPRAAR
jgi:beta-lactamase regulating signal transducer with metallopeptidase domain